ncbi:hypothetical protein EUGRSUZ_F01762 [Eucalyptus grandis]|uniref:Uncharacterized protein n=2 Tax=Eucalyptus grandis TaxID=71139 RepID=A0ACC3KFM9_EUCGR|nr:hypothetical protein EUGRSUZ_F01762 [Eucalyptus grandis]
MEVVVVSREFVKPYSPTPNHLKIHKLSLLDQFVPTLYVPLVLFYTIEEADRAATTPSRMIQLLKQSLSETLPLFYPLAGKINGDGLSIECDDEGVLLVEARAEFALSRLLHRPDFETVRKFLPCAAAWRRVEVGDRVAMIQATAFPCGGVVVGVLISHAAADGASFATFLKGWAAAARKTGEAPRPSFDASTLFIQNKAFSEEDTFFGVCPVNRGRYGTRRLVFDASTMARLKAEAANVGVQNPTRAEVVTALICKSLTATMTKVSGLDKPVVFTNAVNLRRRAVPNFHDDSMGNYVWLPTFLCPLEEKDYDGLPSLIGWLREAKSKIDGEFVRGLEGDGGFNALQDALGEMREFLARTDRLVTFSSWCNFGHYEIDFGWGRPAWVSPVGFPEESGNLIVNTVLLLDTRCRKGIEAWVFIDEQELEVLEQNEELTEYASINPPVSEIED